MKNYLPKNVRDFAHRLVESKPFQWFMMSMILLNIIVLVVLSEISRNTDPTSRKIFLALDVVDWGITAFCILELILRWVEDFWGFWRKKLEIFDFVITLVSILPEIIGVFTEKNTSGYLMILRQLQILRILKLFIRIKKFRITVLIIVKSLKGVTTTVLFLLVFGYVYSLMAIPLFENYSQSDAEGLEYRDNFKNLGNSFSTLFILFTGENWHALMRDIWKVPELPSININLFIITWVILASFMLKAVLLVDVVTNFEYARKELNKNMEQLKQLKEGEILRTQNIHSACAEEGDVGLIACVLQELQPTVWRRSSLLRYLEVMEKLQKNLEERQKMQKLESQYHLNLHSA